MYCIGLNDKETEEIVGYVQPIETMNMNDFDDKLRISWKAFNDQGLADDYSIEDFVEWNNENYEMQIDYVIVDTIQL